MGRARIDAALGEGRYRIVRVPDESFVTSERERVEAIIAQANENRLALSTEISDQEDAKANVIAQMDALLAELAPVVDDETRAPILAEYARLARQVGEIAGKISELQWQDAKAVASIAAAQKRLTMFARGEPAPEAAWCADYTVELAQNTEVSIIAPNDEEQSGRELVVMPQQSPYRPGGWLPAEDGYLQPREWMTEAQAYFNAAVLPGVQRHRPRFRVATINSIDDESDTCSLTLVPAASSAQDLPINANPDLGAVPIVYMTCNAAAFEEGDRVVVEFINRNWNTPVVIGFESAPRPCEVIGEGGYIMVPVDDVSPDGWMGAANESFRHYAGFGYGEGAGEFAIQPDSLIQAGPHFWRGAGGKVVSFNHGGKGRYGFAARSTQIMGNPDVFMLGARIPTGTFVNPEGTPRGVVGAGIINDALVIVVRHPFLYDEILYTKNPWDDLKDAFDPHTLAFNPQSVIDSLGITAVSWISAGTYDDDGSGLLRRPWIFAPDGTKAAMVIGGSNAGNSHDFIYRMTLTGGLWDWVQDRGFVEDVAFSVTSEQLTESNPDTFLKFTEATGGVLYSVTTPSYSLGPGWSNPVPFVDESLLDNGFYHGPWGVTDDRGSIGDCNEPGDQVFDIGAFPDPPNSFLAEGFGVAGYPIRIVDSKTCAFSDNEGIWRGKGTWRRRQWRFIRYWEQSIFTNNPIIVEYSGFRVIGVDYDNAGNEMLVKIEPSARSKEKPGKFVTYRRRYREYVSGASDRAVDNVTADNLLWMFLGYEWGNKPQPWVTGPLNALNGFELAGTVADAVIGIFAGHAELEITIGGVPIPGTRIGLSEEDFETVDWAGVTPPQPELQTAGVLFTSSRFNEVQNHRHIWNPQLDLNLGGWDILYDWDNDGYTPVTPEKIFVKTIKIIQDIDASQGSVVFSEIQHRWKVEDWQAPGSTAFGVEIKVTFDDREGKFSAIVRDNDVNLNGPDFGAWAAPETPYDGQTWVPFLTIVNQIIDKMHLFTKYINPQNNLTTPWMLNEDKLVESLWARDSQSVVVSFVTDDGDSVLYFEVGGAPYDLETALDVPSKVNLRVLGVGPV